jgi:hypothetical protein
VDYQFERPLPTPTPPFRCHRLLYAELAFQVMDLLAERWLRNVKPIGGVGEVQLLGRSDGKYSIWRNFISSPARKLPYLGSIFARSYRDTRSLCLASVCCGRMQREFFETESKRCLGYDESRSPALALQTPSGEGAGRKQYLTSSETGDPGPMLRGCRVFWLSFICRLRSVSSSEEFLQ